jgi:hypothetical protein
LLTIYSIYVGFPVQHVHWLHRSSPPPPPPLSLEIINYLFYTAVLVNNTFHISTDKYIILSTDGKLLICMPVVVQNLFQSSLKIFMACIFSNYDFIVSFKGCNM